MCGMWTWHLWLWDAWGLSEGKINERAQCGEGQLANANNLIEIVLWALVWNVKKQLQYTNKLHDELKLRVACSILLPWVQWLKLLLPLGASALAMLAFLLGVVNTFFLGRGFFLLDTGVRGGGSAKNSTSFCCTAIFSLFSLVRSWSLSLLSWRCCAAVRPLSRVGL